MRSFRLGENLTHGREQQESRFPRNQPAKSTTISARGRSIVASKAGAFLIPLIKCVATIFRIPQKVQPVRN